jgi:hypothetical protein
MLARFDISEDDDDEMDDDYDFDDYDFDESYINMVHMVKNLEVLKKEVAAGHLCKNFYKRECERNFSELHYDNDIAEITEDLQLSEDTDAWAKWTCDEDGNLEELEDGQEDDENYNDDLTYFCDEGDDDKLTESQKSKTREIHIMMGKLRFKIMLARARKDIEADKIDPDYKPDPNDMDTDYETDADADAD